MKRKLCAVVLLVMVAVPSLTFGQAMSGTVGLLGFGPGWYSGATRVIQATVTRAGITEVANIALTTTMRGLLGSAVIAAMVIAEPAFNSGVDAIRTWIATAGISRYNGGIGKASVWTGGPKVFVTGRLTLRAWPSFKGGTVRLTARGKSITAIRTLGTGETVVLRGRRVQLCEGKRRGFSRERVLRLRISYRLQYLGGDSRLRYRLLWAEHHG